VTVKEFVFDSKKGLEISFSSSISRADLGEHRAYINVLKFQLFVILFDRFYGLVVRIPGYRSIGSRFDSRRYQIF
jgi:hypothetical protein